MNDLEKVASGHKLKAYIENYGVAVERSSGLDGSQNCIYIRGYTSFNWKGGRKQEDGYVRVNCKIDDKRRIERRTDLLSFENGKGDSTRPYSFKIDSIARLNEVLDVLKNA